MRLSDEQLAEIVADVDSYHAETDPSIVKKIVLDLLSARKVVEAATTHFDLIDLPGPKVTHATETSLRRRLAEYAALTNHDAHKD
jgi:hypothetical protein